MIALDKILAVHRDLSLLHQFHPPVSLKDYVTTADENQTIVKECHDGLEVMVLLQESLLKNIENMGDPRDFKIEDLSCLAILIEELSHFNSIIWNAFQERQVSRLELEVQAEIDKLAVINEWVKERKSLHESHIVFDLLFENFRLGEWVLPEDQLIYLQAHEIARKMARKWMSLDPTQRQAYIAELFRLTGQKKLTHY